MPVNFDTHPGQPHKTKGLVEQTWRMDAFWFRAGLKHPPGTGIRIEWKDGERDTILGRILALIEADSRLRLRIEGVAVLPIETEVRAVIEGCGIDPARPCFFCPRCQLRARFLYLSWGELLCRRCAKLGYACQREREGRRALRRASKLRKLLGDSSTLGPIPFRPMRMHLKAYLRLCRQIHESEMVYQMETAVLVNRAAESFGLAEKGSAITTRGLLRDLRRDIRLRRRQERQASRRQVPRASHVRQRPSTGV